MVISVANRGLRYGDGLFETMKYCNNNIVFADEHFARLWKGMNVLLFQIPKHFTPEKLTDEIIALAKKNGHDKLVRILLTIFRGEGGLYDPVNHTPNYCIETWDLPGGNDEWNSNGLVLGIYEKAKKNCDILSNIKHNNYLPYVMAALYAKDQKCNDAVLLNNAGRLCDTTIANIFLIKNDTIYTPALAEGCVAGIIRKHLIQQLAALNYNIIEKELTIGELMNADEVFLTNSIYNIRWVKHIDGKDFGNRLTQKIYLTLLPTFS